MLMMPILIVLNLPWIIHASALIFSDSICAGNSSWHSVALVHNSFVFVCNSISIIRISIIFIPCKLSVVVHDAAIAAVV